ncbi:type VI secretion system baseplate subunit TssK [Aliikangiella coralliicola]|uniref:Type VI secretion system baseplate subunit TssK n=1 Tax=Aliikangiella coralliicola TaxID=2592383 RepID=A0A545UCR6_9GAMM|nr:type VI secretion system baseplate subunit TssK [Aliikangiella coralliicola]TQV87261.1 hypothetical protein FLL46_12465 [Aliikangiella coralliicola]
MQTFIDIPHPVQWSEGMLLSPQHFQQQQIYLELRMCQQLQLGSSNYWGVTDLKVNAIDFSAEVLTIERIRGVMPDGLVINYTRSEEGQTSEYKPLNLSLNLAEVIDKTPDNTLTVYIAVPIRHAAAASSNADRKRFDSIPDLDVLDENTGDNAISIERLRPKLELLTKAEAGYVTMPVFKFVRSQSGKLIHDKYLPPLLRLEGGQWPEEKSLHSRINDVVKTIRDKAEELAAKSGSDSPKEKDREKIQTLVSGLLPLEVQTQNRNNHPWDTYLSLTQLLANISGLGQQAVPAAVPKYNHNDLNKAFTNVLDRITAILDEIQWRFKSVVLDINDDGHFGTLLREKWDYQNSLYIELRAIPGRTTAQLIEWIKNCRITCGDESSNSAKIHRGRGASRKLVNSFKDINIRRHSDAVFIQIPISGQEKYIQFGKMLWLKSADAKTHDYAPAKIVLHIPDEQVEQNEDSNSTKSTAD